jgi:chemotaxis protein CheX
MTADFLDLIGSAVEEVFNTMLNTKAEREPTGNGGAEAGPQVVGSVCFIGQLSGVVCIWTSQEHANHITCQLLGLGATDERTDEMVNDAFGEVTNMVGGHFKSRLTDRGYPCRLSIPSIVRGSQLVIESVTDTQRMVANFRCGSFPLMVELIIKTTNSNGGN